MMFPKFQRFGGSGGRCGAENMTEIGCSTTKLHNHRSIQCTSFVLISIRVIISSSWP